MAHHVHRVKSRDKLNPGRHPCNPRRRFRALLSGVCTFVSVLQTRGVKTAGGYIRRTS